MVVWKNRQHVSLERLDQLRLMGVSLIDVIESE